MDNETIAIVKQSLGMTKKESNEDRARRLVRDYFYIFKTGWPKRIHVWAFHMMGSPVGVKMNGGMVIDYYKKLANKKKYFELLEELRLKKTGYERNL